MQDDFSYDPVRDSAGFQLAVTILADRPHMRAQMRDDAEMAGFRILACGELAGFASADVGQLGDLVLVDCVEPTGEVMALLSRLDMRVGKSGAHLVVSTTMGALDSVFGCFAQSNPQILVDPGRSERVIAIGRVLAQQPNLRLRELAEEDRLMMLRLTEQVGQIAERLERLSPGQRAGGGAFRFEAAKSGWCAEGEEYAFSPAKQTRAKLPDPAVVRQLIRQRQVRAKFFDAELFADPAWDILLDLTAARGERLQVSVTSLCIAAGVPATTALRWIGQMVEQGVLRRVQDLDDRRRAFIELSERSVDSMSRYFAEVGAKGEVLAA